jgi:hypothetical protein
MMSGTMTSSKSQANENVGAKVTPESLHDLEKLGKFQK